MTATVAATARREDDRGAPRVAYVVSGFPRLTETFVVDEVTAVVRAGADVTIHPLRHDRPPVVQPEVAAVADLVDRHRLLGAGVLGAAALETGRRPAAVARSLVTLVRETRRSRRLLVRGLAALPYAVALARRVRTEGIDHVHCHFATHPALVGWVVHRVSGVPFSFTAHGSDLHRDRSMLVTKAADARAVVTVSEHNRDIIVRECGPGVAGRVHVVRCGVAHDRIAYPPARRGAARTPARVACVGTLHEVKGQRFLLEAVTALRDRGLDVDVTLVGGGVDRTDLERLSARLGIADRVTITGPVTRDEVWAVLSRSDALVCPSVPSGDGRREGLPVAILEAMAAGVPVVASDLTGIPEAVRDGRTGLLFPPGDVEALADALERVLVDAPLASRLVEEASDLLVAEFTLDASARRLVALFAGGTP